MNVSIEGNYKPHVIIQRGEAKVRPGRGGVHFVKVNNLR